jgi:G2/mitotic-specific cyclin-B, other
MLLFQTMTLIFALLPRPQNITRPFPYMERRQPELNSVMRAILVDWLVEVHMKFRLLPETLYLCVNIIDRYLALQKVLRNKLQLVGVTALLIACKYEEIYPPEVRDCVYITDRAYTRQEVLDMEAAIVKALKFTLTVPTGYPFIQRFLHVTKSTAVVRHLASYYMERMLQEHSALAFKPSLMAAAAVCLATNHPDRRDHDDDFEEGTRTSVFVSDCTMTVASFEFSSCLTYFPFSLHLFWNIRVLRNTISEKPLL